MNIVLLSPHGGTISLQVFLIRGLIDVWDKPGLGIDFIRKAAIPHLTEEDKKFFD